jgi:hypothetical protein
MSYLDIGKAVYNPAWFPSSSVQFYYTLFMTENLSSLRCEKEVK